jgi:hypothetical protein
MANRKKTKRKHSFMAFLPLNTSGKRNTADDESDDKH